MNKSAIRQIYKEKRRALLREQVESGSKAVAENFTKNLLPRIKDLIKDFQNKKLAIYVTANNEVDPTYIISSHNNILSLPKIVDGSLVLDFKEYKLGDELVPHSSYTKLLEPKNSTSIIPDIVFVPLVAFDKNCNRIGMGAGFYDATIEYFRKNHPKTIFIGLGYDTQEYPLIESHDHDQSLDFIISETLIIPSSQYTHG